MPTPNHIARPSLGGTRLPATTNTRDATMLRRAFILLVYLLFFTGHVLATNTTNTTNILSINDTILKPWCIFELNIITYSWAVIIPNDGSKTEDGIDKAGKCGGRFRNELPLKGTAISDWYVEAFRIIVTLLTPRFAQALPLRS